MLTLGIETSGRAGAVALCRDGRCLAERLLEQAGRRHAQTLVAEIGRLFDEFDLRPADCNLVAVSIGPGSFTGLRVGVVCAKTFAYATGCSLTAVDTYQCIAENSPNDVHDVWVTGDAQRDELYVGRYRRDEDRSWVPTAEITIVAGRPWCRARTSSDVVSGPGIDRFESELASACRVLGPEYRDPRAAVVARLGERKLGRSGPDDFWSLEPFYLRRSAAEEKWDATH